MARIVTVFFLTIITSHALFAQLFQQQFNALLPSFANTSTTDTNYIATTNTPTYKFTYIGSSSNSLSIAVTDTGAHPNKLYFKRTSGTGTAVRNYSMGNPSTLLVKMDISVISFTSTSNTGMTWQVGDGFANNTSAESATNVHSFFAIRLDNTSTGVYKLRNAAGTNSTITHTGTTSISFYINNSGSSINYTGPDGSSYTLANDTYDLWGGTTREFSAQAATTASQSLNHFKLIHAQGNIAYDNLQISEIAAPTAPTVQTSSISFSSVGQSAMTVSWTNGNGSNRAVFVREGGQGTISNPVDGTVYTASSDWSAKGTQLASSGYYCVYNGSGNSVTMSNLTGATTYWVQAFEYNGGGSTSIYNTSTSSGNPNSQATQSAVAPTVTTAAITNVTGNSASGGGNVTSDGGASVTARGVCWNTTGSPTLANSFTADGTGTGSYQSSITGLMGGTTYFVRAYATNALGTSYGDQVSFSTLAAYYNLANTDVTNVTNWGSNTNGTGLHPGNFTTDGVTYNLVNTGGSMSGNWTVSGTNSKVILGDGTNAVSFTVPATSVLAADIDVNANATLKLQNTTLPNFGTLNAASTVEFDGAGSHIIPAANYGNLSSTNDAGSTRTLASGNVGIAGTFTPGNATYTVTGNTISFNGSAAQSIPAFSFNGVTVNNNCSIPAGNTVTINGSATVAAGKTLTVDGTLVNNATGNTVFTTNGTIIFSATGVYTLAAAPTTANCQIPTATWQNGSICRVFGIIGVSGSDYNNLYGIGQTFSKFEVNTPNLVGKLVMTYQSGGNFVVNDAFTVLSTGTGTGVQLTRTGTQIVINMGSYSQSNGNVYIVHNASSSGNRNINIAGNFALTDTAKFILVNATGGGAAVVGSLNVGGNFSVAPGATFRKDGTTNGVGNLVFNGSAGDQTATFGLTSGTINYTVNKSAGNVIFTNDPNISGVLTLTGGRIYIGNNNLTFGTAASVSGTIGASNFVVANGSGAVIKNFASAGSFTFPIGDTTGSAESSPLLLTINSGTFSSGTVSAKVINAKHPNNISASSYLNRYWQITSSGITGLNADVKAKYNQADVVGTEANIYMGKYSAGSWAGYAAANTTDDTLSAFAVTSFGDFTGGEAAAFGGVNGVITMKCIPEGYYDAGLNRMNMKDTFTVYLANITTPYAFVDSAKCVLDSVSFSGTATFVQAANGTYYIAVKGRNSLETWSKSGGQAFVKGSAMNYDFTTAAAQTYSGNAIQKGANWCMYSGDVNRDGFIDFSDLLLIDNDSFNFASGYLDTDVTGDLFVDFTDLSIVDNNSFNFIGVVKPGQAARPAAERVLRSTGM